MGPADGVGADLAHAPVLHLALFHQVGNGLRHLLGRHVRVGAVLVEHRQRVEPQAAERILTILANRCRTAVLTPRAFAVNDFVSEFGRHVDSVFELRQRFACQILVGQRPVDDGRIEKRYATFHSFM